MQKDHYAWNYELYKNEEPNNDVMFSHANLHDFRLNAINVDYINKQIELCLSFMDLKHECKIIINDFLYCSISKRESFGSGAYIYDSFVKKDSKEKEYYILTSSGDECVIKIKK